MLDDLLNIISIVSPITQKQQQTWKVGSDKLIKRGLIEPLSDIGLIQAIDRVAFEVCYYSHWCLLSNLSIEECDNILKSTYDQLDDIIAVIGLASGIHPTSVDVIIGMRSDWYSMIYSDVLDNY